MSSKTDIANLSLTHLGNGRQISDYDNDTSAEAKAIRAVYPLALKKIHRDFDWPFTTKFAALALVADRDEQDDPDTWYYEYQYTYTYPSDCLSLRKIQNGERMETPDKAVPYRIVYDSASSLICTDMEDAIAEYTILIDTPTRYPADFEMALSLLVAGLVAPRIAPGDPNGYGKRALQMYEEAIGTAKANALLEEQRDLPADAELIRARG